MQLIYWKITALIILMIHWVVILRSISVSGDWKLQVSTLLRKGSTAAMTSSTLKTATIELRLHLGVWGATSGVGSPEMDIPQSYSLQSFSIISQRCISFYLRPLVRQLVHTFKKELESDVWTCMALNGFSWLNSNWEGTELVLSVPTLKSQVKRLN